MTIRYTSLHNIVAAVAELGVAEIDRSAGTGDPQGGRLKSGDKHDGEGCMENTAAGVDGRGERGRAGTVEGGKGTFEGLDSFLDLV